MSPPGPPQQYQERAKEEQRGLAHEALKIHFAPWLLHPYRKALKDDDPDEPIPRTKASQALARWQELPIYPPRPDEKLASITSVDKPRDLLKNALGPRMGGLDFGEKDLGYRLDGSSEPWAPVYLEKVYAALIDIIEEEGVDAWLKARWEVYDMVRTLPTTASVYELMMEQHDYSIGILQTYQWKDHRYHLLMGDHPIARGKRDGERGRRLQATLPEDDGGQDYDFVSEDIAA